MNARVLATRSVVFRDWSPAEGGLIEALRRERRHAAIVFLSTGMAIGIGFSLALDMVLTTVARL